MKRKDLSKAELICLELYEKAELNEGIVSGFGKRFLDAGKEIAEQLESDLEPLILKCGDREIDISDMVRNGVSMRVNNIVSDRYLLNITFCGPVDDLDRVLDMINGEGDD